MDFVKVAGTDGQRRRCPSCAVVLGVKRSLMFLEGCVGLVIYCISWPIRHTMIFSLEILEKKSVDFSNLLEENRIVNISCYKKVSRSQAVMPDLMIWNQISLSDDKDV
jgi:hypothetical protein